MILYISKATDYSIFNELFKKGDIKVGHQSQKFNYCMIRSLSLKEKVSAVSALPYNNVNANRIEKDIDGVKYVAIENVAGKLHKIFNVINLIKECKKVIKKERPSAIICDAIALSPRLVSIYLGKKYKIKTTAIITDLPGLFTKKNQIDKRGVKSMQRFDNYILLTEQMNAIVNPKNKPYVIIEGMCDVNTPKLEEKDKKFIMFAGTLSDEGGGLDYFTKGFIKANLKDVELHYYGTGKLVEWILNLEKEYPNIKYKGYLANDEVVRTQAKATLLINPRESNWEYCKYSFPSKTIEYMLSGTPVLMTKLPGIPNEYFNYAFTIDKENEDGVCEALKNIFSKSDKELMEFGLKAREFMLENKNPQKQAEKIIKLIRENGNN